MTAGLRVHVLRSGDADAELAAWLDACPVSFAQQTPAWRDVIAGVDRDEPAHLACRRSGRLVGVLPAYRFDGPLGAILNTVPQAGPLGGVACDPDEDREAVYQALLAAYVELGRESGCALASVITNPFWPDRELCERHLEPDYALDNTCQVLDLSLALDPTGDLVGGSTGLRRNLRKAAAAGLRIDEAQTAANVAEWYALHQRRHRAIGATPLPEALFTGALEHMVPRDKARFFFVRPPDSDAMVAGGFYVYHGAVIDALMPAVSGEHPSAGFALALHTLRWARARGLRYYNWQASPPESGVYRFKRQWGSRDLGYAYLTRITGDATAFTASSVERVRDAYRWHYTLPYDRIGPAAAQSAGPSSRASAWSAAER